MSDGLIYVEVEHPHVPGQRQWKSLPLTYRVQVAGEIVSFADLWECWREHGGYHKEASGDQNPRPRNRVAKTRAGSDHGPA